MGHFLIDDLTGRLTHFFCKPSPTLSEMRLVDRDDFPKCNTERERMLMGTKPAEIVLEIVDSDEVQFDRQPLPKGTCASVSPLNNLDVAAR